MIIKTLKQLKRITIILVGFTVLSIGILMIVLPGPAFILIPVGLSILATELIWAKKLRDKLKDKISSMIPNKQK
ncbi:MAG: PGPGW domain-containing protein [Bacteroidota bacterium]|jgi:tellurite resistance protein TerC